MNIDEMQAGPEIDRLVAKEIMGWTIYTDYEPRFWLADGESSGWAVDDFDAREMTEDGVTEIVAHYGVFRPSVDWGAAGLVFEKMPEHKYIMSIFYGIEPDLTAPVLPGYSVQVWHPSGKPTTFDTEAETAPLAICRAALKTILGIDKV